MIAPQFIHDRWRHATSAAHHVFGEPSALGFVPPHIPSRVGWLGGPIVV